MKSIQKSIEGTKVVTKPTDFIVFIEICVQLLTRAGFYDEAKNVMQSVQKVTKMSDLESKKLFWISTIEISLC